ncbi:Peptidyl-prolyl cis-trans isomerase [Globisporangium polare]
MKPTATLNQQTAVERYGTFHGAELQGDAAQQRERSHRSSLVRLAASCTMALALVVAMIVYSSPHLQQQQQQSREARSPLQDPVVIVQNTQPTAISLDTDDDDTEGGVRYVRVFHRKGGSTVDVQFSAVEQVPDGADAWATFNDSLVAIGWSQLWINTTDLSVHELQHHAPARRRRREIMFAAGYAEAALTHHRIDQHFENVYLTFFPNGDATDREILQDLQSFLRENFEWMREQVEHYDKNPELLDAEYWGTVGAILAQFDGLVQGYQRFSTKPKPASEIDLFMLNADGDLQDLIPVIQRKRQAATGSPATITTAADVITQSFYTFLKNLKCSALIRILPDFADLVWGHATWDVYSSMNRIYKHYEVPLVTSNSQPLAVRVTSARRKISMSSSPGYLSSVDDWYMTNAGLGVMETTHGVFNSELYALVTPRSVLCWLRSKVANFLGEDGMSWAATFSKYNSGTYNDQWMIIDTKRFVPGSGFQKNGLMILEQLPGFIHVEDVSLIVNELGYWGSYNVPYFSSIYERSGFLAAYKSTNQSASWSYANCTRAKIFQRDAPQVTSFEDLKRIMRYNNWREDPFSSMHASHAVASRYDLETDPTLFTLNGAIDAKVTSWGRMQQGKLESEAVSGPTHEQNPVFEWTMALSAMSPHVGQPQRFNFTYQTMVHG